MERKDFKKGQVVFLKYVGSDRRGKQGEIEEGIVDIVGNKYITVKKNNYSGYKFEIDNDFRQSYDYGIDYKLYLTLQQIEDENEVVQIANKIRDLLSYWKDSVPTKLTLRQLRCINKIIDDKEYEDYVYGAIECGVAPIGYKFNSKAE